MKLLRWKTLKVGIAIYLSLVLVCLFLAFDSEGAIDGTWTLVLIGLTLPWSLVSLLFLWSLIHGADLGLFASIYILSAGLNSWAVHYLALRRRKRSQSAAS